MFIVRRSRAEDVGTLLQLARMVYFINLPPDERIIAQKIQHSRACFARIAGGTTRARADASGTTGPAGYSTDDSDLFMFCAEDAESGGLIGTSQVKARMGGPGNPNYSFRLSQKRFFSPSLGVGTTHLIARLHEDIGGPTELGGLIVQPSYRGHPGKPGRLLSFVRFHFIGLHRALFGDRLLAEMMAQVTSEGDNLFWDHIGRRFIPVKYSEADRFCQHNRSFIDELLPKDDLYLSLLPLEVLNQVGRVSAETAPARRLLERLGFEYKGFIDPFDGGPHLEAVTDQVPLIARTRTATLAAAAPESKRTTTAIVSAFDDDGEFRALCEPVHIDASGRIGLSREHMRAIRAEAGQTVGFTPLEGAAGPSPTAGKRSRRAAETTQTDAPARPRPRKGKVGA